MKRIGGGLRRGGSGEEEERGGYSGASIGHSQPGHSAGINPSVEIVCRDMAEPESGVAEAGTLAMRFQGDFGGPFVTDVRIQRCHEHEAAFEMFGDAGAIRFDAGCAADHKGTAAFGEEFDRLEEVMKNDGLENVQLKVTLRSGEGHRLVVAVDLDGDHGEGFGLSWVNLARHDRRSWLVVGNQDFADAGARAGGVPA